MADGRIWTDDPLLPYLSAHTRQESDRGAVPKLKIENWKQFAEPHKDSSIPQKTRKLLEYFASRSRHHGDWVTDAPSYDYPLLDAASEEEWHFLVRHLLDRGELELAPKGTHPPNTYRLTVSGWSKRDLSDQVQGGTGDRPGSLRVFLCHAKEDKTRVNDIYQRLKTDGFSPWLDEEDLLPGQNWQEEIPKAVRAAHVVVVCLSQNSTTKEGYFQKEIKIALDAADEKPEGTIFIIPAKLEECKVPERLARWHWVNLFEEQGYAKLKSALYARASDLERRKKERDEPREERSIPAGREEPIALDAAPAIPQPASSQSKTRLRFDLAGEPRIDKTSLDPYATYWVFDQLMILNTRKKDQGNLNLDIQLAIQSRPGTWLRPFDRAPDLDGLPDPIVAEPDIAIKGRLAFRVPTKDLQGRIEAPPPTYDEIPCALRITDIATGQLIKEHEFRKTLTELYLLIEGFNRAGGG